jgi:hypothetical protein
VEEGETPLFYFISTLKGIFRVYAESYYLKKVF